MAIVKGTGTTVLASTASTTTSSAISSNSDYATAVYISIVQVGTATTAAQVQISVSPDGGTTYYNSPTLLWAAGLGAGTYQTMLVLDPTTTNFKAIFTAQVGGTSSTVVAQSNDVTAV
jgi:hypothetical protein